MRNRKLRTLSRTVGIVALLAALVAASILLLRVFYGPVDAHDASAVARATKVNMGPLDEHVYATIEAPASVFGKVKLDASLDAAIDVYAIGERSPQRRIELTTCRLSVDIRLTMHPYSKYDYQLALVRGASAYGPEKLLKSGHIDAPNHERDPDMLSTTMGDNIDVDLAPETCAAYDKHGGLRLEVTAIDADTGSKTIYTLPLPAAYFHGFMHKADIEAEEWQPTSLPQPLPPAMRPN